MKKICLLIAVAAVIGAAAVYSCWPRSILLQGEVVIRQLTVSPRIAGRVDSVLVQEGDAVQKGQPVAALYAPDMLAKASQVQAPRDLARKNLARAQELYDGGVVSAQQLDEARARLRQTAGAADATLSFVDEMTLYSPVDGEVSAVVLESGELASPGVGVLTVLDTSDVWVTFNVREDLLKYFTLNGVLDVQIPGIGDGVSPFRVTYISKKGDYAVWSATKTRGEFDLKTFEVRAKPVEAMPRLRQGMTALLRLRP